MDRRSPAPSCGDLRRADETKAHHAGFVIGASISAYCPDQAPPRSVNVRTTASRPRRLCAPTECSLSSNAVSTFAAGGWFETALGLSSTPGHRMGARRRTSSLMVIAAATTSTRMSAGIQVRTANYCRQAPGSAGSLNRIELQ